VESAELDGHDGIALLRLKARCSVQSALEVMRRLGDGAAIAGDRGKLFE
jgi:hypothetical protein